METTATNPPALATQPETLNEPIAVKKKVIRAPKHDFKDGNGRVFAHRHDNGRGWVADTAKVEDTVYIGSRCSVYNYAHISGFVRMEGASQAFGHCRISGNVKIKKLARVSGRAIVRDTTMLHDTVVVTDHAVVSGDTQIFDQFMIHGHAIINSSRFTGRGRIYGESHITRSNISGLDTVVENRAILVHATISGRVTVTGFAQVLHSTVSATFFGTSAGVSIADFAVIADGSRIQVPIEIKNHAVIVRSQLSGYTAGWVGEGPMIFGSTLVASGRNFLSRMELENFINNRDRYGNPIQQNPSSPPPAATPTNRAPVSVTPAPRRIMRPQEAEA